MTDLRLMPSRIDGGLRRREDDAVAHDEDVLARALADVAVVVEEDRLLVAGLVATRSSARIELRYWPEALACGISESGLMRRQEETLARMPLCLPSSPR